MYRAVLMLIAMAIMGSGLTAQDFEYETLRRECIKKYDLEAKQDCLDELIVKIEQDEESRYKWALYESTSRIDDSPTVGLVVHSREPNSCRHSVAELANLLALRCLEDRTSVIFGFDACRFGNYQGYNHATIRLDNDVAKEYTMEATSSKNTLGLYGGRKAIPFIKDMLGAETMIIRIQSITGGSDTISFDISNLAEEIAPLRTACHW